MTSDCATVGRTMMMARQYIAMMKLGFMPIDDRSDPTVSFSTAPAASRTATRMMSRVESPSRRAEAATVRGAV